MTLRVALVQTTLAWQDGAANRAHFAALLAPFAGEVDLVVLPEMFSTGFHMEPERFAEPAAGPTFDWLRAEAARLDAAVCGSVGVREAGHCFNRLLWAEPDGAVRHYDKRHLFRMGHEHEHYRAGSAPLLVRWRGWSVCPLVCYDLRFPVWSRRRPGLDYELLLYVANWPAVRAYPWTQLLKARAIENQACVIGVNRIGADGNGVAHAGDSAAYDALGQAIAELGARDVVRRVELDRERLHDFRQRFPAHLDADPFTLAP